MRRHCSNRRGIRIPPDSAPGGGGPPPGPGIVTAGLEVHLDAGDPLSYPGTGLTWTDMENSVPFTLQAKFPTAPPPAVATEPFYNSVVGYFNFIGNNAAGTLAFTPAQGAVEMWFRWRDTSGLASAVLLTGTASQWLSLGHVTAAYPDESIEFNSNISAVMDDRQGHTHYRDGDWHQLVVVIDGNGVTGANLLYVDGVPLLYPPDPPNPPPNTTFRSGSAASSGLMQFAATIIGKYTAGYQFDGDIAIVRVYDTPGASFSAADVAQNYAADAPRFATFQPDNISGLTLWLDPSDANSLELNAGAIVEVRDKALALQLAGGVSTGVTDPTLTTVGGINWMTFNGVDQYLDIESFGAKVSLLDVLGTSATGWEMHAVIRADTATGVSAANPYDNNNVIMDSGGFWGIAAAVAPVGTEVRIQPNSYDSAGSQWNDWDVTKNQNHIFGLSYAGGVAATFTTYQDGATLTDAADPSLTPSALGGTLRVGAGYGTKLYNGRIGEVCIFDRPLTPAERADLLAYLKAKWGTP